MLAGELLLLPQPATPMSKQIAIRNLKRLTRRVSATKNINASTIKLERRQRPGLSGNSKPACGAVVETVSVVAPLFVIDDGLSKQVLSLGFPEHDSEIAPAKLPDGAIVIPKELDDPRVTVRLDGFEPVLIVKSGALIVTAKLADTADAQFESPEK